MRFLLLISLLFSGCVHFEEATGEPLHAGRTFTLTRGYSMYPLLIPGEPYRVVDTHYEDLTPGMIVKRYHRGYIFVHKLGNKTMWDKWTTYGINNDGIDPELMTVEDFIGEVRL